jgi:hypothetical protein
MKHKLLKRGMLGIMLVFGLVAFVGCPDADEEGGGGGTNPLIGTWYNPVYQEAVRFLERDVQISENVQNIQTAIFVNYGTYTVQGNNLTIALTPTYVNEVGVLQETYLFSVTGTSLILSNPQGGWIEGNYTKQ